MEASEKRPAEVDDAAAPATADDDEEDDEEEATTTTATTTKRKKKRRKAKGEGAGGGGNHQVYIRPAHQANLRITSSPSSGRCAVAARDLQPGYLIFEEEPVALVLFQQHQGAACHYCGRGPVRLVEGSYPCCSPECFSKRQMTHQLARPAFLQVEEIALEEDVDAELLRMVTLLACKRHIFLNKPAIAGEEGPRIWASVDSLMDHREHMTPEFLACITKGLSRAMKHLPANVRLTPEEAVRLA